MGKTLEIPLPIWNSSEILKYCPYIDGDSLYYNVLKIVQHWKIILIKLDVTKWNKYDQW